LIVANLAKSVKSYLETFLNERPKVRVSCPDCGVRMHGHGRYFRGVRSSLEEAVVRIPLYRVICPHCQKTLTVLPHFLRPYSPYTLFAHEGALLDYSTGDQSQEKVVCDRDLEPRTFRRWLRALGEQHWSALTGWLARRVLEFEPGLLVTGCYRDVRHRLAVLFRLARAYQVIVNGIDSAPVLPLIQLSFQPLF
jgi:hypothetical protein